MRDASRGRPHPDHHRRPDDPAVPRPDAGVDLGVHPGRVLRVRRGGALERRETRQPGGERDGAESDDARRSVRSELRRDANATKKNVRRRRASSFTAEPADFHTPVQIVRAQAFTRRVRFHVYVVVSGGDFRDASVKHRIGRRFFYAPPLFFLRARRAKRRERERTARSSVARDHRGRLVHARRRRRRGGRRGSVFGKRNVKGHARRRARDVRVDRRRGVGGRGETLLERRVWNSGNGKRFESATRGMARRARRGGRARGVRRRARRGAGRAVVRRFHARRRRGGGGFRRFLFRFRLLRVSK
mmetsp:Transcript_5974/g.25407  ORF Transcript_5974/g.25407 Transcript_5974/m.25407 type:complete len:302 (-) Transcript_5974:2172-3077(-)